MFQFFVQGVIVVLLLSCSSVLADDATIDPHAVYEENCAGCHEGHAGEFAFSNLELKDGNVAGIKSGTKLSTYLSRGHGRLEVPEQAALEQHLATIVLSGQTYRVKCMGCHDRAIELARGRLVVKDGVLIGRYSQRDIAGFLEDHGRLTEDEVAPLVSTLTRLRNGIQN